MRLEGVDVLWSGPYMPRWLYPLSLIAASHGGLLMISNPERMVSCIDRLSDRAMFALYLVSRTEVAAIADLVNWDKWRSSLGPIVSKDPRHFCLGADGDSPSSPTGIHAWVSYGRECEEKLKHLAATSPS